MEVVSLFFKNSFKIPNEFSEAVKRQTKERKTVKGNTMIYKTIQRKQKIEQLKPNRKLR